MAKHHMKAEQQAVVAVEQQAVAAAPTAAEYHKALAGWTKPYAPSPLPTWQVEAGPGMVVAKHGACASRHAAVTALLAKGPTTVTKLVEAGYTMADVRWGLSPAHRGGAKLVVK